MTDVSDIDKLYPGPHESVFLSCASADNFNDVHSSNPRTQTTDEIKSHEQFADQVTPWHRLTVVSIQCVRAVIVAVSH